MAEKITGYTSEMCQQAMIDELKELSVSYTHLTLPTTPYV